jgi:triphosphatase
MDSFDEIEMKLTVSPGDLRRAEAAALATYKVERSRIFTERAIYYDTSGLVIRSHGGTLRVRRGPAGWEQVIKQHVTSYSMPGSALARREWRWSVDGESVDLNLVRQELPNSPELDYFAPIRFSDLRSVFETQLQRASYLIEIDGELAEITFDEGKISNGPASVDLCEIEVEAKGGGGVIFEKFHRFVQVVADVCLHRKTKADFGYALALGGREPS